MPEIHGPATALRQRIPDPGDARTRILDAAERLVQARGVPALTLEAVAREAGISKGGLLYHFASKEAMLAGLLNRLADHVEAEFLALFEAQPPSHARATRAILSWLFDHPEEAFEEHQRAAAVFLAAFHHDPGLLDPIRVVFARIRDGLRQDALPPGHALAVMAASDGLFFAQVFGMYALDPAETEAMRTALETLVEPRA
jgi:AcrR family transcriptional regulator